MTRFSEWFKRVGSPDYSAIGDENAESGKWDSQYDDAGYPGPLEHFTPDADNYAVGHSGVGSIKNLIQYEQSEPYSGPYIQGGLALTMNVGSTGVVDPSNVDAHNLDGGQAIIRRFAEDSYGPVATSDHNSLLSLLYAMQETASYLPNESSQIDMVRAV